MKESTELTEDQQEIFEWYWVEKKGKKIREWCSEWPRPERLIPHYEKLNATEHLRRTRSCYLCQWDQAQGRSPKKWTCCMPCFHKFSLNFVEHKSFREDCLRLYSRMFEAGELHEGRHFKRVERFRAFLLSMNLNKSDMKAFKNRIKRIEREVGEIQADYFVFDNGRLVTPGLVTNNNKETQNGRKKRSTKLHNGSRTSRSLRTRTKSTGGLEKNKRIPLRSNLKN